MTEIIRIEIISFEIFHVAEMVGERHHQAEVPCVMTIGTETIFAQWFECIEIVSTRFPFAEFISVWEGHTFIMTPTGRTRQIIIDPVCSIFAEEVFE